MVAGSLLNDTGNRTAIIIIHQLPRISEMLWLRILGKWSGNKGAIAAIEALAADRQFRTEALRMQRLKRLK